MKYYKIVGIFEDHTTVTIVTDSSIKAMMFKNQLKKLDTGKNKIKKLYVNRKEEIYGREDQ